jgi:hypothetical protein
MMFILNNMAEKFINKTGGVGNFSLYANVGLAGYVITIGTKCIDIYCPINNFVSGHIAMQSEV